MDKKEAIEKVKTMTVETFFSGTLFVKQQEVIAIIEQIGEPTSGRAEEAPRYLRNILARLRGLPEHDRNIWLKGIMGEFKKDFSHAKWREGYEQGKFEGAVEAKKSNKVVVPQFVADWIEVCKAHLTTSLYTAMNPNFMKENDQSFDFILWIKKTSNQETFARAWLDGYEVEQEKRYVVTDGNHLYFKECQEDIEIVILADEMPGTMNYVKKFDSKDEAQKVADVLGWKVKEVQDDTKI